MRRTIWWLVLAVVFTAGNGPGPAARPGKSLAGRSGTWRAGALGETGCTMPTRGHPARG